MGENPLCKPGGNRLHAGTAGSGNSSLAFRRLLSGLLLPLLFLPVALLNQLLELLLQGRRPLFSFSAI